jgi:hypothetical protein
MSQEHDSALVREVAQKALNMPIACSRDFGFGFRF